MSRPLDRPMASGMATTTASRARPRPVAPAIPRPAARGPHELDSRRVIARLIDGVFVGAPFLIPVLGLGVPLSVVLVSVCLGVLLRVRGAVGPDDRQAPARPARADARRPARDRERRRRRAPCCGSSRTARSASSCYLVSGKRRAAPRRPGRRHDRRAPAPGLPRAGFSPLLIVYPAGSRSPPSPSCWPSPGTSARQDYLSAVDKTCAPTPRPPPRHPRTALDAIVARTATDHRALAAVDDARQRAHAARGDPRARRVRSTARSRPRRRSVKAGASARTMQAAVKPIGAARQRAAKRYAELGLRSCAGLGVA